MLLIFDIRQIPSSSNICLANVHSLLARQWLKVIKKRKHEDEYAKLKKEEQDKRKKTYKRCAFGSSNSTSSSLKILQYSCRPWKCVGTLFIPRVFRPVPGDALIML